MMYLFSTDTYVRKESAMKSSHKRLLSLCLSLALLLVLFPASQAEAAENDPLKYLTYSIADGAVTITGCDKNITGSLEIPDTIHGSPVIAIDAAAFSDCDRLTTITIPEGITTINWGTFQGCSKLTSVTIPKSLTFIDCWAFENCTSLREIIFLGSAPSIDSDCCYGVTATAYYSCMDSSWTSNLKQNYGGDLTWVGHLYSPYGSDLSTSCTETTCVTRTCTLCGDVIIDPIPATGHQFATGVWVKEPTCQEKGQKSYTCNQCGYIKYAAFPIVDHQFENGYCIYCEEPETITYPEVASGSCGKNAKWRLDTKGTLTISGTGAMYDYFFSEVWDGGKVSSPWFPYYSQIKSVDIRQGITTISENAFRSCRNLTSLTIPESVTSVGWFAFSDCTSLTTITIPDGLTHIGAAAFDGCSNLNSITIPNTVTTIGNYAFSDCTSLRTVTLPESITAIGEATFMECTNLAEITFLGSAPSFGKDCFSEVTATVYYSCMEKGWDSTVEQNYGGKITWNGQHLYSPYVPGQSASCTADATEISICSLCGDTQTRVLSGTATGHIYKITTVPPSCTEDGCTIQECSNCDDVITTISPASGHRFENGVCVYCGETEQTTTVPGDASGDGKVNMADVAKVFAHVRNKNPLTDEVSILCADVTGDGKINMADVARIFAHARGTNPLF